MYERCNINPGQYTNTNAYTKIQIFTPIQILVKYKKDALLFLITTQYKKISVNNHVENVTTVFIYPK